MSRSKSPDNILERLKSREKSPIVKNLALSSLKSQDKISKLYLHSQGNRINSLSNLQSSKKLHRKISATKIKSSLNKSPSGLVSIKSDLNNSLFIKNSPNSDTIKKIDQICKIIEDIDKKVITTSQNFEFSPIQQKFDLCNSLFSEIIEKDKAFGKYLTLIKLTYEDYFQQKLINQASEIKNQLKDMSKHVESLEREKYALERSLDKISKENLCISQDLEDSEKFCSHLQEKLSLLHTFNIDKIPLNKET